MFFVILIIFFASVDAYFLNDEEKAVYYFNGEKNTDTWEKANTVCNLLGADLLMPDGDFSFIGNLKNTPLWTAVRTDPSDASKYIYPDGRPFDDSVIPAAGKRCRSETCCAIVLYRSQLETWDCIQTKAHMCKFRATFADLKPKFDMIDTIESQLENFNKTMDEYTERLQSIETSQSHLVTRQDQYNKSLSEDIEKTVKLAEHVETMADDLKLKHDSIVAEMDDKISVLQRDVDGKLEKLSEDQETRFIELSHKQDELSDVVRSVQENVTSGQEEMMDAIDVMNRTINKQSEDMIQKLLELRKGLEILRQDVDKQISNLEKNFNETLDDSKAGIDATIEDLKRHIEDTDQFMSNITEVHKLLEDQFTKTKAMIEETDARVRELDEKTEDKVQTMTYVNTTLNEFRENIESDEVSLKSLKTATYTILSLLFVAVILQYVYIFRHKLSRFNPINRSANID